MRPTWAELRAISKKWPYPNYIIIPAAGSLFDNMEILRGKTAREVNALTDRILSDRGAREGRNNE